MDASGTKIGTVKDLGAAIGEVFPKVTAIAFEGPAKAPLMVSWRKYVDLYTPERIELNVDASDVRFTYVQPDEILLKRDLLNKQVVDTAGKKAVRVTDLKLSCTADDQLRLLGAEVGVRGVLRSMAGGLENVTVAAAKAMGKPMPEHIIAWSNLDLLDRELPQGRFAMSHRSLDDLHPADIAEIVEQLDPKIRAQVFSQLDTESAAATMSELTDEIQADVIGELPEQEASAMIAQMDPDDAADIIGELDHDKAEALMGLMDASEQRAIRQLLGYSKNTAGGIMTSEFVAVPETFTVAQTRSRMARLDEDFEQVFYVYTLDAFQHLSGVVLMRDLVVHDDGERLADFTHRDLVTVSPETNQTEVADELGKYDLVSIPVVNEEGRLLGIVTVDDALDVIEEEHERDMTLASGARNAGGASLDGSGLVWFLRRELWFVCWVVAACVACALVPSPLLVACVAIMPIVLLVSDDLTTFASSQLFDDDDEKPTLLGLAVRDLLVGLVVGFVGWLAVSVANWAGLLTFAEAGAIGVASASAMCTIALLLVLAAPFVKLLERFKDTDAALPVIVPAIAWMVVGATIYLLLEVFVFSGMM